MFEIKKRSKNPKTDWKEERVRALVAAAEDAVERTRWVFLVINLGSAIMITAQVNIYWSWAERVRARVLGIIADRTVGKQEIAKQLIDEQNMTRELACVTAALETKNKEEALNTITRLIWNDLYSVSMPLLGIKYNADDLILLGTAGMSVLALWFFYANRRENHCIGTLWETWKKEKTNNPDKAAYIYAAVAHYFVFTNTTDNDKPFYRRRKKSKIKWYTGILNKCSDLVSKLFRFLITLLPFLKNWEKPNLRWYVITLTHLPWVSSLLCIGVFIACLVCPEMQLVQVKDPKQPLWDQISYYEARDAVIRIVLGLIFTFVTIYCCFKAHIFDSDTAEMLKVMDPKKERNREDDSAKSKVDESVGEPVIKADAD